EVKQIATQGITALAPALRAIQKRDRNLADQLRRAATSIVLNIAEAEDSDPGNSRARLFTAAGSTRETRAALAVAAALGYVGAQECAAADKLLDEVSAILYRLLHPRTR